MNTQVVIYGYYHDNEHGGCFFMCPGGCYFMCPECENNLVGKEFPYGDEPKGKGKEIYEKTLSICDNCTIELN